ncbi:MAG: hypothetical protein J0I41_01420 [Filimonas sp.]|nr:hypothetical protein [Filimonas sp.]
MIEINNHCDVALATNDTIIAAAISGKDEVVFLLSNGTMYRYNTTTQKEESLFSVKSQIGYSDGGFDLDAPSTIYTLDEIVVIVNDFKRHGFIHYPGKYEALHLWREDYHADISKYPIALFKNKEGVPHIIYAEAWNHVQIMNLDTRQVLTAAKSLIEEGAEEKHLEIYAKQEEANKLPWPRAYDYFFGRLEVSPDNKWFLSAGWHWGSFDACVVYEVADFITNNRISDILVNCWEHENRAICWIDGNTIAVAYNPYMEGEADVAADEVWQIHFYKIEGRDAKPERTIKVPGINLHKTTMRYHAKSNVIIAHSTEIGFALISLNGDVLLHDPAMKANSFNNELGLLLYTEGNRLVIHELK